MKKYILMVFVALGFGCQESRRPAAEQLTFIEKKIGHFANQYPNWQQNDIIQDSVNIIFRDSLLEWSKQDEFLNGIPFQLEEIEKYESGTMAAIGEVKHTDKRPPFSMMNDITMTVSFILKPEMVGQIRTNGTYHISGRPARLVEPPKGRTDRYLDKYDLGVFIFEADSISPEVSF